jgi:hypothetical protein
LSGTVHRVDKDTSTIIVRKGSVQREVVYNAETKFTIQNKPDGSSDDVIVGRRVICRSLTKSSVERLPFMR